MLILNESFVPVARLGSIRLLMAMARLVVHQLNVTSAFLKRTVEEDIYMELPEMLQELLPKIATEQVQGNAAKMMQAIQEGGKVCHLRVCDSSP